MTIKTTTEVAAGLALPSGAVVVTSAARHGNVALAIAGMTLVIVGIAAVVIHVITRAITDTSAERRSLQEAESRAVSEYMRYLSARATLDADADRLCREAAQLELDSAHQLIEARETLQLEFDDRLEAEKRKAYFKGMAHATRGAAALNAPNGGEAVVIQLPFPAVGSNSGSGQGA